MESGRGKEGGGGGKRRRRRWREEGDKMREVRNLTIRMSEKIIT